MKLNRFILIFLIVLMIVPTASVTANDEPVTAPSQDTPEPEPSAASVRVKFVLQGVKVSNINQLLFAKRAKRYAGSLWYFYSNGAVLIRYPNQVIVDATGTWRVAGKNIIVAAQRHGAFYSISFVDARIGINNLVARVTDVGSGSLGAEAVAFTLRFRRVY